MGEQEPMMQMLQDGVPVTLLVDIVEPPDAETVYEVEGGDADWLPYPTEPAEDS